MIEKIVVLGLKYEKAYEFAQRIVVNPTRRGKEFIENAEVYCQIYKGSAFMHMRASRPSKVYIDEELKHNGIMYEGLKENILCRVAKENIIWY